MHASAPSHRPTSRHPNACLAFLPLIVLLPFAAFAATRSSPADKIAALQNNPAYVTGLGEAATLSEARSAADKALVSQIQISVGFVTTSTATYNETDRDLKMTLDYVVKQKSFAGMLLKGLTHVEDKSSDGWRVLAAIHRDSLAASFALRKSRIVSLSEAGSAAVARGDLGSGLQSYYQAWLLAQFYPDTLDLRKIGLPNAPTAAVALSDRINKLVSDLEVLPDDCYQDAPLVMAPLTFKLAGKPVRDLTISYYGGQGMEYARVRDDRAELPFSSQPASPQQKLIVTIDFMSDTQFQNDPELAGLAEMFADGFNAVKVITLTYPWLAEAKQAERKSAPDPKLSPPQSGQPSEALRVLKSFNNTGDFLDVLEQYRSLGKLIYGKRADIGDSAGACVAVMDEDHVAAILIWDGSNFKDIATAKEYHDLGEAFKGLRQVWFREVTASAAH